MSNVSVSTAFATKGSAPTRSVPAGGAGDLELRLIDAALACVARWGLAKTTLDDVAREAGSSRATVYRMFPGGRDAVVAAVVSVERDRFLGAVSQAIEAAESLEDALVAAITEAGRRLAEHRALQFVLAHEPEVVLPHVCFAGMERLLAEVAAVAGPRLERWLAEGAALRVAEWCTRLVLSYAGTPGASVPGASVPGASVDVSDPSSVAELVRVFVLPGARALAHPREQVAVASRPPLASRHGQAERTNPTGRHGQAGQHNQTGPQGGTGQQGRTGRTRPDRSFDGQH